MHVRMKRRYSEGFELGKKEFGEQPWADGILVFDSKAGRNRLGLYQGNPGSQAPPLGMLWRPELAACVFDTISFCGTERVGKRWFYQVWYCETRAAIEKTKKLEMAAADPL